MASESGAASQGREFQVYDDQRTPRDWTSLVAPAQCAVFFKDAETSAPLSPRAEQVARYKDCTFLRFDSLAAARAFCEARVREFPFLCCEIYDSRGKACAPLLSIVNSRISDRDEMSPASARSRFILAALLAVFGAALILWDWLQRGELILPTVLGIGMVLAALRLLHWNAGLRDRRREQQQRLQAHLLHEKERKQGPPPVSVA